MSTWLENGRLPANDQQAVDTADLVDFMQVNHLAVPRELLEGEKPSQENASNSSADQDFLDIDNNGEQVLVIEDDRPMAIIIERVFRQLDIATLLINAPVDLLNLIKTNKAKLVTLELENHNLDTLALIRQIKAEGDLECKILVISRAIPSTLAKAKELGADVILSKPFDMDSLRRTIKIMLGQI